MAEAKQKAVAQATRAEQGSIEQARKTLKLIEENNFTEATKLALDLAGTADPSGIADSASLTLSMATGDYVGAFLSVVSMCPYLGDAVAKPPKLLKAWLKNKELEELFAKATKTLVGVQKSVIGKKIAASKQVAEDMRRIRAQKGMGNCRYGTTIPKRGTWNPKDTPGNGVWTSESGHTVPYENGYPQFEKASRMENGVEVPAVHPDGGVEIPDMVGDRRLDYEAAEEAMRAKWGKDWKKPDGYTWHHKEDTATMLLVREDFHHGVDGANHCGGAAIAKDPTY